MSPQQREAACAAFLAPMGLGYIRSFDNDTLWTLFDDAGNALIVSDNRSSMFFFAAQHDIIVHRLH